MFLAGIKGGPGSEAGKTILRLSLDRREGESFAVGVVSFEAIGACDPLDCNGLRLAGDVSFVFGNGLLEDFACREQGHFDLVRDSVILILTAVLDAVHEFASHASAAQVIGNLQVQSHGEVLVCFNSEAIRHDAAEHQAVCTDFTEVELDGFTTLQGLDFVNRKAVELGGNHLHVLRVVRALRLDGEEVRLGGELHELGLHFVPNARLGHGQASLPATLALRICRLRGTAFRERSILLF